MKTFDFEQVHAVLSPLKARFEDCAHGEGDQCATLDKQLDCCAEICLEMHRAVLAWAQGVFAGRVVFDPEAERLWKTEIAHIYARAQTVWRIGRRAEVPCWDLPGQSKLETVLWNLRDLLENWVTPAPSVGPAPRSVATIDETVRTAMRERLAKLPLPAPPTPPGQVRTAG